MPVTTRSQMNPMAGLKPSEREAVEILMSLRTMWAAQAEAAPLRRSQRLAATTQSYGTRQQPWRSCRRAVNYCEED